MIKLMKISLVSAVLATGTMATTVEVNNDTTFPAGMTVELEANTEYVFADGVTLHNYTEIQGPTSGKAYFKLAEGASANVINYKDQLVEDSSFPKYSDITGDYYLPTGAGSIGATIDVAGGINQSTQSADITTTLSSIIDGTIVLVGNETTALPMTSTNTTAVSQNIANEPASGDVTNKSRGLAIEGKFKFTGDNSHFTNESVTVTDSTLTFAGEKSLFQSNMEFTDSTVTLSQASTFGKSLTVQGGSFVINAPLTFTAGSSFILKAPLEFVVGGGNYAKNNSFAYTLSSASYTISLSSSNSIDISKTGSSISISSGSEFLDVLVDNTDFDTGKIRYKCISSLSDNTDFLFTDNGERTSFTAKEIWDLFEAIRTGTATYSGEVSTPA